MLVQDNGYAFLSGSLASGAANPVTLTVVGGQGNRLSSVPTGSGKWFVLAIVDATPNKVEILHCYQRDPGSPDTLVCLRARDGTTAKDWSGGGTERVIQISDTLTMWQQHADIHGLKRTLTGVGTNTVTGSIASGYQTLLDGMEFIVTAAAANTGAMTFAPTFDHSTFGGTTYAQSAHAIFKGNDEALVAGDVPFAGYPMILKYVAAKTKYHMANPAKGVGFGSFSGSAISGATLTTSTLAGGQRWSIGAVDLASSPGTSKDFTGIPSWATRVTMTFAAAGTNGTSNPQIQLGTSGGMQTSGYAAQRTNVSTSSSGLASSGSTGFIIPWPSGTNTLWGSLVIELVQGSNYIAQGSLYLSTSGLASIVGGKSLASALTQVRLTTVNGTDQFNAGNVNVWYE